MTGLRLDDRRASLLFLPAALLVPMFLSGCAKTQDKPPRPVATVSVVQARRASVPYVIEANGVVTPLQSVLVSPQVDGIITSVDFQEGQEVRQGQALFHIDPRPYQNAYEQALAVLQRDSVNAANAKGEYDRYQKLLAAKVITPQEGAAQMTTAGTTEATVRADRANVAQARFNLENTIIRAPIAGKTGGLLVRRGNLVRSGGVAPLVIINQVRPILVRFSIPSSQLGLILQYGAQGGLPVSAVPGGVAPASPSIDSMAAAASASVSDPAGQSAMRGVQQQGGLFGDRMTGKLSFIDNAVDTATGTVQLKATFDNANGRLWAGQFATTSLHLYDEDSALVVPTQAVVTGQRGAYVYIVDKADTARQRPVTVERTAGNLSIIATGIHEGDRVVLDGQSRLVPDAPVKLRSATDAGGGGGGAGRRGRGGRGAGRGGQPGAAGAAGATAGAGRGT
ncbi:MAG: efflux transporter, family, subunit [Gemmatimonadetes bacterium]|nr:efflux transporter, family, subunit [Gemmatimonadota bacterium]